MKEKFTLSNKRSATPPTTEETKDMRDKAAGVENVGMTHQELVTFRYQAAVGMSVMVDRLFDRQAGVITETDGNHLRVKYDVGDEWVNRLDVFPDTTPTL